LFCAAREPDPPPANPWRNLGTAPDAINVQCSIFPEWIRVCGRHLQKNMTNGHGDDIAKAALRASG
jgi:hypothetical protein